MRRATPKILRLVLGLVVLLGGVSCDRVTKQLALEALQPLPPQSWLGGTIRLQYAENPGAFLGLGHSLPRTLQFWGFTLLPGALLAGLCWFTVVRWDVPRPQFLALTLIMAGGTGNVIDRVLHNGMVIDFISLGVGPVRTGIFNMADVAVTAGAGMLLVVWWRKPFRPAQSTTRECAERHNG
jgi:signal peptidase II